MNPPVSLIDVTRRYGDTVAVDSASLQVASGSVHCLLGPNGAGKTTLLRLMAGLVAPSEGSLEVLGGDPYHRQIRSRIGWVPSGDRSFYMRLTGKENLLFFARMYGLGRRAGLHRANELLALVDLESAANKRVSAYSHGMTKRLAVARALLTSAPLILVDEATHDLDIEGARLVRELFRSEADRGAAVVWSTHRLTELPGLVDTVTVLDRGNIRFHGSLEEMLMLSERPVYRMRLRKPGSDVEPGQVGQVLGDVASVVGGAGESLSVQLTGAAELGDAVTSLLRAGYQLIDCSPETDLVERAVEARLRR